MSAALTSAGAVVALAAAADASASTVPPAPVASPTQVAAPTQTPSPAAPSGTALMKPGVASTSGTATQLHPSAPKPASSTPAPAKATQHTPQASQPSGYDDVPLKKIGLPAPTSADKVVTDDEAMSFALSKGSASELRDMAAALDVKYPADITVGELTCQYGSGHAAVWAINFVSDPAQWNIALDGTPYARAVVTAKSHGYASLMIPDGRHTVTFTSAATGKVATSVKTGFSCAAMTPKPGANPALPGHDKPAGHEKPAGHHTPSGQTAPVVSKPASHGHHGSASHAKGSVRGHATAVKGQARPVYTKTTVAPKTTVSSAAKHGPAVQADYVSTQRGTSVLGGSIVLAALALGGMAALRRLRGFFN